MTISGVLAKSHTKTLEPRRKIVDPHRMELHYDRSVDFGSVVECSAENKVGASVANVTIPGKSEDIFYNTGPLSHCGSADE
jgi:hypothetical protein